MSTSPKKVLGVIPGQPMQADAESRVDASAHGAEAPKPTHTMRVEPNGVPVNPAFTNGGMTPNDYPYRGDWAVESGTHA